MIVFGCPSCGMKLQVRDDFAGRTGPCPTCKQPLTVPNVAPPAAIPTGPISGTPSSLHAAGLSARDDVGVTLAVPESTLARGERSAIADILNGRARTGGRYMIEKEIARGGMGAVVRAVDCDIRREVAVKYMLDDRDFGAKARFVEEAQITGQLEHPNIVPIHELGVDAEKRLFFAMKMVRGRSLAQVLDELRKNPAEAERTWTLGRLLTVMTNVCYAMSYAHSRGVIHRDLKPANIMLGDFGETYVMDWGLAKVVAIHDPLAPPEPAAAPPDSSDSGSEFAIKTKGSKASARTIGPAAAATNSAEESAGSVSGNKVSTSRELEGELTQDGAIMGTPSYMSPEQARGEVNRLDPRSDIYSLAAILYELLTLASPIEKDGGAMAILTRVVEGKIKPPEVRTPVRAKAGKIPKELAAVAMKGLALRAENRYQTAEGLRRDIERFQEGRSVSAKQDTPWEAARKFVKRNKAFSAASGIGIATLAVVLAVAFNINNAARVRAEEALVLADANFVAYEAEQKAKNDAIRNSIPGTLRAARQLANDGAVADALKQIALVRQYEPNNLQAALLRGQILTAQRNWPEAVKELAYYLQRNRTDADAVTLYNLAVTQKTDDLIILYKAAEVLRKQHLFGLTPTLLQDAAKLLEARKPLHALYEKQTRAEYQGVGVTLRPTGELSVNLSGRKLTNVNGLREMQFNDLNLSNNSGLVDLEGLRGMPLTSLNLTDCTAVESLEALRGMKLQSLDCSDCPRIHDIEPLRGMPLEDLSLHHTAVSDLTPLTGMPLRRLKVFSPIESLEPLSGMQLERLKISSDGIRDLKPLRGMPLTEIDLNGCGNVTSLEPLRGMPCRWLQVYACEKVESLEPLRGMPCVYLNLYRTPNIKSLEPLRGMPLEVLYLDGNGATDLSPLADSPLAELKVDAGRIERGMEVVRNLKSLKRIFVHPFGTMSPTEFWRRYDAGEFRAKPK